MSIIGYDCDGRELKSGDAVVILEIGHPQFAEATGLKVGDVIHVISRAPEQGWMVIDVKPKGYKNAIVDSDSIRKVEPKDNQTGVQTFSDLMHGLGCDAGVPA